MLFILNVKQHYFVSLTITKYNQNGKLLDVRKCKFKCLTPTIERAIEKTEAYFFEEILGQKAEIKDLRTSEIEEIAILKTFSTRKKASTGTPLRTNYFVSLMAYKNKSLEMDETTLTLK